MSVRAAPLRPAPAPPTDAGLAMATAALFITAFALLAVPPAPDAPPVEVLAYVSGHRSRVFAAALLIGAGAVAFVWFLARLGERLAPARPAAAALAGVLSGLGGAVIVLGALGVLAGLALHVDDLRAPAPAVVGFDVYNALVTLAGFLFAGSVILLVAASARHGTLPRRLRVTGRVIAALQLLTLPGLFVQHGFLAAGGPMALIAFWLLSAWFVAVALVRCDPL